MKLKKVICLITAIMVSTLSLVGCGGNEKNADNKLKVTMITGVGGINDRSFNQSSWEGLQKLRKI